MKRLYLVILVCIISIGFGTWLGTRLAPKDSQDAVVSAEVSSIKVSEDVSIPKVLEIERLGVLAAVEEVGVVEEGRMGVPVYEWNVGWWRLGSKPGENGTAVIAGHVDTPQGTQGVFYELKSLEMGDEIVVYDVGANVYTFSVVDKQTYAHDEFPVETVFANQGKSRLHLITCSGAFDNEEENYEERLVIFAELIEEKDVVARGEI